MFDIGFLEILVILIIALLVIGPDRMPEVARKLGSFMGKTRRFINQMKDDSPLKETVQEVHNAMNLEEEKRHIDNIGKELEEGLNFNQMEIDADEFQRPFGGDVNQSGGHQFNKAPSQPEAPKTETTSEQTEKNSPETEVAQSSPSEPTEAPKTDVKPTAQDTVKS